MDPGRERGLLLSGSSACQGWRYEDLRLCLGTLG